MSVLLSSPRGKAGLEKAGRKNRVFSPASKTLSPFPLPLERKAAEKQQQPLPPPLTGRVAHKLAQPRQRPRRRLLVVGPQRRVLRLLVLFVAAAPAGLAEHALVGRLPVGKVLGVGLEDAAVEEVGAQRVDMGDEDPRAEGAVALVLGFGFWAEGRDESEFFPPL